MQTILLLQSQPRNLAQAVRKVLEDEEFEPVVSAPQALKLLKEDARQVRLFVLSQDQAWTVVGLHSASFDFALAAALAAASGASGWLWIQPKGPRAKGQIWQIKNGQTDEEAEELSHDKAQKKLVEQGIAERLLKFKVSEHLAQKHIKEGKHEDIMLGFKATASNQTEVEKVLGQDAELPPNDSQKYTLDEFLDRAVGNPKVRNIARAQIGEQLKKEGFNKTVEIYNPEPQGHFCEAFEAESYSFTSNGPYVWFEWSCEEACEPRLDEEIAFPSCDLKFKLEKGGEA